jgi:folate-binding protein YgfZ
LWLNQKGKVVADSFVLRLAEQEHLVWAPRVGAGVLRERLESYLIADEVEIADVTAAHSAVVLWGTGATQVIRERWGAVPSAGTFAAAADALVFRGRFSRSDNFVCLGPDEPGLVSALAQAGVVVAAQESLEAERIASALPAVPDDIGLTDLPNEGGLEVDAISYTKGCYLGQEVMSRLKNLGQVRRRLFVVEGEGEPPAPRTAVLQGEKQIGETRSGARVARGFVAMAMLSLVNLDPAAPAALADGRVLRLRHG